MKKGIIIFITLLLVCFLAFPNRAMAERTIDGNKFSFDKLEGTWVNGEQFPKNGGTIKCGKGEATLDTSTKPYTLTLTNCTITKWKNIGSDNQFGVGIYSDKALDIMLVGSNTIEIERSKDVIGIACDVLNVYSMGINTGWIAMKLKVNDDDKKSVSYASLLRQRAVGIYSTTLDVYGGNIYIDASDELNYTSHAIYTEQLKMCGNGHYSFFGSGGAFNAKSFGDRLLENGMWTGFPLFSQYSTVSNIMAGKGYNSKYEISKEAIRDGYKYTEFDVSTHCNEVKVMSVPMAVAYEFAKDTDNFVIRSLGDEICVDSKKWFKGEGAGIQAIEEDKLYPYKFVEGETYTYEVVLSSRVPGMLDAQTKISALTGNVKSTGKYEPQSNKYVMQFVMKSAKSQEYYEIWINGERIKRGDFNYPKLSSHYLELKNAELTKSTVPDTYIDENIVLASRDDITIHLEGENRIHVNWQKNTKGYTAIKCGGNITFTGRGSLIIDFGSEIDTTTRGFGYGIDANGITIEEGCSVTIKNGGIFSHGNLVNSGSLNVYNKQYDALFMDTGDIINTGSLYASTGKNNYAAITLMEGKIDISSFPQQILGSYKSNAAYEELEPAIDQDTSVLLTSDEKTYALTVFVGVLGHVHVYNQKDESPEYIVGEPTCNEYIKYYYSCECGKADPNRTFESRNMGYHKFNNKCTQPEYLKRAADCQNSATYYYKCAYCEEHGTETFNSGAVGGHSFTNKCIQPEYLKSAADCTKAATYYYKCETCEKHSEETFTYGEKGDHVYKDGGKCEICGSEKPHTHTGVAVAKVDSDCQNEGMCAYYSCQCGKIFEDLACTKEITDLSTLKIGKKQHDYDESGVCKACKSQNPDYVAPATPENPTVAPTSIAVTISNNKYIINDAAKKEIEFVSSKSTSKTVKIPDTVKYEGVTYKVTTVSDKAFSKNNKITSVTIGKYVKTIGKQAFYSCKNLSKVTFGKNVATIGDQAFYNCKNLSSVTIGNNVKTIGSKAFYGCKKLTSVVLPSKVSNIGAEAFKNCSKLKKVTIKSTKLTTANIGKNAFKGIYSKAVVKVPSKKLSAYKKLLTKKGLSGKQQTIKK